MVNFFDRVITIFKKLGLKHWRGYFPEAYNTREYLLVNKISSFVVMYFNMLVYCQFNFR